MRLSQWRMIVVCLSLFSLYILVPQPSYAQSCLTRDEVAANANCLYILSNRVYKKGSRSSPHKGHPCGMDITSIIPSFHTNDIPRYLTPNFFADICTQTPTNTPTPYPTNTPAPTSTQIPTATSAPAATATPTPIPPTPTNTPIPTIPITPGTCALKIQGDATCDDKIDLLDYICWVGILQQRVLPSLSNCKSADFDNNNTVDTNDYQKWLQFFINYLI